ncbi:BatA domain-containing protein [Granulosicoccus sp. 3-233]|uniref:BatA domain-containing protein n=1 Tax=Granulosicoccus sp. 3-233 TaxID=3417969 RepID=UPI003D3390B0
MSLLFPAYLAGLLGLALPWLLHRFSDQRAPEQAFPSRRFLEATTPPVSRTRQLKYLILLALRVLSLLLLCLVFAQPWLNREGADAVRSKHHVIAIDQSLSMRAAGRWPAAIDRARDIVSGLPAGDSVELLGIDDGIRRTDRRTEPASVQLQALSAMEPGHVSADYGSLMQGINRIASESDVPVTLWLITDVQQSALPTQLNALYAPQLDEMHVESVVTEPQRNVHLQASALSTDGVNVQVNVQLMVSESSVEENASPVDVERRSTTVQLYAGDRLLAEQQVTLQPFELQTMVFDRLVMPAVADPVFTVALAEPDDLPDDDRVDVVVRTANPMPVVLLATERQVSDNAAVFLATALETDDLASVDVITGNAERVSAEVQHVISGRTLSGKIDLDILQFVDSGANALLFSAEPPQVTQTSGQLAVPRISGSEMGVSDDAHPLQLGRLDWSGTRFYDVPPLLLVEGDRVLLQTSDRLPVLVERLTERGRLLILNDRLDGSGSNLPLQPAFVSLMQSILNYFDASTALPDQIVAGERLALPARVQVLDPTDQPLLTLDASAHSGTIELDEPGMYKIVGARGEHALQVVLDSREANIATLSPAELAAWQNRYTEGADTGESGQGNAGNVGGKQAESGSSMSVAEAARLATWQLILPVLLLLFIMESALANRRLDVRRDGS